MCEFFKLLWSIMLDLVDQIINPLLNFMDVLAR